ncbi:MAG: LysR family transcriptional regulator [Hydrogenophaga sp.]|uniref:LysR family transcriptional regulator n=1 Tax=Hydrogenophaga sp. TaxID=1904254 RepID=UPI0025B951AA|nr:LysR family transcriptional regulator [Hydrogenophaga sp.]MBU7574984.1 LysR family transcriptional regulator [Hydrogenophaga sp.]
MKKLDLNLLRLLVALDQTRHLGRAAEALQMSQSGLSTALARLRDQLGDELFVRSPGGMRPTPRALLLAETARTMLLQVEQDVFGSTVFDPLRSETPFRLSMSDVAEVIFLPDLIAHLAIEAPGTSLQISSPSQTPLRERLATGEVDLAIGYLPDLERDAYFRQSLYSHTYACMVRKGHPAVRSGLTRSVYASLGHAVVKTAARSTSLLEEALERERIQRKVVLGTPSHLSLPVIVARSDLVATVPMAFALEASKTHAVAVLPLPFRPPSFPIHVYWHRRTHREPSYQWLRAQIKQLFDADGITPVQQPARKRPAPRRSVRQ